VIAYDALTRLGRQWKSEAEPLQSFLRPEASRLWDEIANLETPHWRRAEIGDRLARIGDRRPGVGLTAKGLPDIVWCRIPAGTVTHQDQAGTFKVEAFDIARYPVTYCQYRAFLEATDGYQSERWWQGLQQEADPGIAHRTTDNCPADSVSWYDAVAFCRWLSAKLQEQGRIREDEVIRLPTEWEWQQAATGGDAGREYPWGVWDERCANTNESQLARTTAVGMYPHGSWAQDAPRDMAGNVFEWCLNKFDAPEFTSADESGDRRVLRGGSWGSHRHLARCSFRGFNLLPVNRGSSIGFRVLCSSPID
jgi:formylglycine-generating enzyme required for sulfatase activity